MKKYQYHSIKLTMTDKLYNATVEKLHKAQGRCREHIFDSVENLIGRLLMELDNRNVALKGEVVVEMPETSERYARRCKFSMKCTRAKFVILNGRIVELDISRGDTGAVRIFAIDDEAKEAALRKHFNIAFRGDREIPLMLEYK